MKKTVAVDLDAVLARYDGWKGADHIGSPLPGAVDFTHALSTFAKVLIFTTRTKEDLDGRPIGATVDDLRRNVEAWLRFHGFHFDDVYCGQGKPIASAYIDDRAVACEPQLFGQVAYVEALARTQQLCKEHK